jgi:hypothetical protein
VNIYPFHSGIRADIAIQDLDAVYKSVAGAAVGKKIIVTETGWPSEGTRQGNAVPSGVNSGRYFEDVYHFSREEDIEIVWFSSYSEPWKAAGADYEAHFGLFTSDERLKGQFGAILRTILDVPSDDDNDESSESETSSSSESETSSSESSVGGCATSPGIWGFTNLSFCAVTGLFVVKLFKKRS